MFKKVYSKVFNKEYKELVLGNAKATFVNEGDDTFLVEITESGVEIINYLGKGGEVIIPSEVEGSLVTKIGENAFVKKQLREVVIPDSVTSIGGMSMAFSDNPIKMVASENNPVAEELAKELGVNHLQDKEVINKYKRMVGVFL